MAYYANQKSVIINKPDKGAAKVIIDRETLEAAAHELTGNEFKLFMFFASDSNGFKRDYSPAHFADTYGLTPDTARKLFKQLEQKGFISKDENKSNLYTFNAVSQKTLSISIKVEKRYVVDEDGVVYEMTYREFKEAALKEDDYSDEELKAAWDTYEIIKED